MAELNAAKAIPPAPQTGLTAASEGELQPPVLKQWCSPLEALDALKTKRIDQLVEAVVERRTDTLFLGAGFSMNATGGVDWQALSRPWRQELIDLGCLPESWDTLLPPERAQHYQRVCGRAKLESHVNAAIAIRPGFPGELEKSILRLPVRNIVTTNYDDLIERTLDALGIPYSVIVDEAEIRRVGAGEFDERVFVYKMHGDAESQNMVITSDDYRSYRQQKGGMLGAVQALLRTDTPVFYGLSLTDPNLQEIIACLKTPNTEVRGVVLTSGSSSATKQFLDANQLQLLDFANPPELMAVMNHVANTAAQKRSIQKSAVSAALTLTTPDDPGWADRANEIQAGLVRDRELLAALLARPHAIMTTAVDNPRDRLNAVFETAVKLARNNIFLSAREYAVIGSLLFHAGGNMEKSRILFEHALRRTEDGSAENVRIRRDLGRVYRVLDEPRNALRMLAPVICADVLHPSLGADPMETLDVLGDYVDAVRSRIDQLRRGNRDCAIRDFLEAKLAPVAPLFSAILQCCVRPQDDPPRQAAQERIVKRLSRDLARCSQFLAHSLNPDADATYRSVAEFALLAFRHKALDPSWIPTPTPSSFEFPVRPTTLNLSSDTHAFRAYLGHVAAAEFHFRGGISSDPRTPPPLDVSISEGEEEW